MIRPEHAAPLLWLGLLACSDPPPPSRPTGAGGDGGGGGGGAAAAATPYEPPAESCAPALVVGEFAACNEGQGIFGTWVTDGLGLPAYDYGIDQRTDDRAIWRDTEGVERRDHWHAFGNARVNATISNEGFVQVLLQDRGPGWLNVKDEAAAAWAGGVSFVDDGEEVWSSAHAWLPPGATAARRFGLHHGETVTTHRELRLTRRVFAPVGDHPYVVVDVTIDNLSATPRGVRHHEAWDVGRRSLETEWVVSGDPLENLPRDARARRDARNELFDERVRWDREAQILAVSRSHAAGTSPPDRDAPTPTDWYPPEPFLAALVGDVVDVWTTDGGFFGGSDRARPRAVVEREDGEGIASGELGGPSRGGGQPRALVLRSDVEVPAGGRVTLRFAYGASPWGEAPTIEPTHREASRDLLVESAEALRPHLLLFQADDAPVLHRELAWHSAQVEASVGWRDYWQSHVVPQGSAYLYLHGADGAARDLGIFAVPLVFTHAALAREELRLYMGLQRAEDGGFAYAFQGHGVLDDALGLHHAPSDLPLFFAWALGEYLGATGDLDFLDEVAPFWPRQSRPGATTADHLEAALRHFFDVVGVGEHGLVRVGTGDWSDGITLEARDRSLAITLGESVPNTQMAAVVLPRIADLLEARDPALAAEVRERVLGYREALAEAWGGSFYGRAYFGDGVLVRGDEIDLEAQVWALAGDLFDTASDRSSTLDAVHAELDLPSPAGATLRKEGQVWPAISGLLTWGYAQHDPERAWTHLARNTMAGHAKTFPSVWSGIWSGPDGAFGPFGDRPGEPWFSVVTPMTDFPVMNANQHTMPMLAALRVAGLDVTAKGLRVRTRVPSKSFRVQTELVDLERRGTSIAVTYRPRGRAARELVFVAADDEVVRGVACDGVFVPDSYDQPEVTVLLHPAIGRETRCLALLEPL